MYALALVYVLTLVYALSVVYVSADSGFWASTHQKISARRPIGVAWATAVCSTADGGIISGEDLSILLRERDM